MEKSFTKEEFTKLLSEEVCKFTDKAPESSPAKANFIIELTLAMFSAQILTTLFDREN